MTREHVMEKSARPPPHTHLPAPVCLFMSAAVLPSHDKYGCVYKQSRLRRLYWKQLPPGKTLCFRENNSSAALRRSGPRVPESSASLPTG